QWQRGKSLDARFVATFDRQIKLLRIRNHTRAEQHIRARQKIRAHVALPLIITCLDALHARGCNRNIRRPDLEDSTAKKTRLLLSSPHDMQSILKPPHANGQAPHLSPVPNQVQTRMRISAERHRASQINDDLLIRLGLE